MLKRRIVSFGLCLIIWLASITPVWANSYEFSEAQILQAYNNSQPQLVRPIGETEPALRNLLAQISGELVINHVQQLESTSRCVLDPGHAQAAAYIKQSLVGLNYTPKVQSFYNSLTRGEEMQNIMIYKRGGDNAKRTHLIVAHWDSSPNRQFPPQCNSLGPGANDNGTGAAVLLEIARVLANPRINFQDDIELVWLDAEEFGLLGSRYFVERWATDRNANPYDTQVGAVINLDMVGYKGNKPQGEIWAIGIAGTSQALVQEGAALAANYLPSALYKQYTIGDNYPPGSDPNRNSDHLSFWQTGLGTAIYLAQGVNSASISDPKWHTPNDKLYDTTTGLMRLDAPMLADASRIALMIIGTKARIIPGKQRYTAPRD